jgi:hypothetical protein
MKALYTAIYTLFTATSGGPPAVHNSFYTAIGGRLYFTEAPQAATFPYCVYSMISNTPEYFFNDELYEEFLIQFSLFDQDNSASDIGTNMGYLKSLFDDCSITVASYGHLLFERELSGMLRDADNNIWHYSVDYNVILEKS